MLKVRLVILENKGLVALRVIMERMVLKVLKVRKEIPEELKVLLALRVLQEQMELTDLKVLLVRRVTPTGRRVIRGPPVLRELQVQRVLRVLAVQLDLQVLKARLDLRVVLELREQQPR